MRLCARRPAFTAVHGFAALLDGMSWVCFRQDTCSYEVLVYPDGMVSSNWTSKSRQNKFSVSWKDGRFPSSQSCPGSCQVFGDVCSCGMTEEIRPVFSQMPTVSDLAKLKIGCNSSHLSLLWMWWKHSSLQPGTDYRWTHCFWAPRQVLQQQRKCSFGQRRLWISQPSSVLAICLCRDEALWCVVSRDMMLHEQSLDMTLLEQERGQWVRWIVDFLPHFAEHAVAIAARNLPHAVVRTPIKIYQ